MRTGERPDAAARVEAATGPATDGSSPHEIAGSIAQATMPPETRALEPAQVVEMVCR